MSIRELQNYRYRGARALVLLHEQALRGLLPVWQRAKTAHVQLPSTTDPHYASLETLLQHTLRSAGGYMTWLCEKLGLPDPGIQPPPEPSDVQREAARYVEHLLERWRLPLAEVEEARFAAIHKSRWGEDMSLEGMLEHAAMHPVRHRFQLEELMEAQGKG
jgi:uncharacterized damage-inducible protein DinB